MTEFVPGDIVALLSGGPLLTVRLTNGPWVIVNWFSAADFRETVFAASQLCLIHPADAPDEGPPTRLN